MNVRLRLATLLLIAALPAAARADFVASEEQERAQRAKISKGLPADATASMHPYPGAKLDVACSVSRWDGSTDYYVFRTSDPLERVQAWYRERAVDATRGRVDVLEDGCEDAGTAVMIGLYPPKRVAELRAAAEKRREGIAALTASPPDPASLGRPLPPDATFDPDCTYDQNLKLHPDYERVVCYRSPAANYDAAYQQLRALDVRAGSWERNVIVRIEEKPAPVRLQYWIGKGGPEKPKVAAASAAAPTPSASASTADAAPAQAAPAATPSSAPPASPPAENPADAAKKAVDKLKGLFGR